MNYIDMVEKSPDPVDCDKFLNYVAINKEHNATFGDVDFQIQYNPYSDECGVFRVTVSGDTNPDDVLKLQDFFRCWSRYTALDNWGNLTFSWSSSNMIHPRLALTDRDGEYVGTSWT